VQFSKRTDSELKSSAPGVTTPGVRRSMADLHPDASFPVEGQPDWMVVTDDAVWVTSSNVNHVVRLDAATNRPSLIVTIDKPCSGLAAGFGAVWIPSCGAHALVRVDPQTGKIVAQIPAGPADSEGGITTGDGSVWMVTSKAGLLVRVDPQTNKVVAKIAIPSGSYVPAFAEGAVWITSTERDLLTRVDARSNQVVASIPIGPQPRFLTVGAGSGMDPQPRRWNDFSRRHENQSTGGNHCCRHPRNRWRNCLRGGIRLGDSL